MSAWQAVIYALVVWYFSTGVILYLDGLPRWTFRWSLLGASVVAVGALAGLRFSSADTTAAGAYCAFTCGVLVWAWQEVAFLMGFVTGPRRNGCVHGCTGWRHFGHAVQAVIYHELAIVAGAALVAAAGWGGANQFGLWTYLVLWGMRLSAKFNVFLGVRNVGAEFLPDHLSFLKSFLTTKPMNLLFPFSVTAATVLVVLLIQRASAPGLSAFSGAGLTVLTTMTVLGLAEHWFLVLPLPFAQLWSWGMRSHRASTPSLGAPYPGSSTIHGTSSTTAP